MRNISILKAHKGGKASVIVGNIREVEVMITGTKGAVPYYDVILRTGAWGKDIIVPAVIARCPNSWDSRYSCGSD